MTEEDDAPLTRDEHKEAWRAANNIIAVAALARAPLTPLGASELMLARAYKECWSVISDMRRRVLSAEPPVVGLTGAKDKARAVLAVAERWKAAQGKDDGLAAELNCAYEDIAQAQATDLAHAVLDALARITALETALRDIVACYDTGPELRHAWGYTAETMAGYARRALSESGGGDAEKEVMQP